MDHTDHTNLLRDGIPSPGGVWVDFGAGTGAFTLALADLLGPTGEIIAIDRDASDLRANESAMRARFPETGARYMEADFSHALDLPMLDGIVCANALHFAEDQARVVELLRGYLGPSGRMLVVEYNIDDRNFAVPYPLPFSRWQALACGAGFAHTRLLARRPSRFLREIYAAASYGGTAHSL
jgi:ubiquinone/menaquinone biosynthesis C-methylase UbiE